MSKKLAIINWALEKVIGVARKADQEITPEDQKIIDEKRFVRPDGSIVTFELPQQE